jgi:hypothetical protein
MNLEIIIEDAALVLDQMMRIEEESTKREQEVQVQIEIVADHQK